MIEFLEKEKRNDVSEFISSFSKRQTKDLSKLNIPSFSDFLLEKEEKEESENPNKNLGKGVLEKEKMLEDINFLTINFPSFGNSVLNDIICSNIDINETKIKSFIYN